MPSSSSSSQRAVGDVSAFVYSSCEQSKKVLKDLASKITSDVDLLEGIDIKELQNNVLEKAIRVAEVEQFTNLMTNHIRQSIHESRALEQERRRLSEQENGNNTNDLQENRPNTKRKLTEIVEETKKNLSQLNHKSTVFYKNVERELQIEDEDDEVMLQQTGFQDQDLTCPYSRIVFDKPMSNNHPNYPCKHHVNENSLKAMVKNTNKCPVSGCSGQWFIKYTNYDTSFHRKMQRHQATKKAEKNTGSVVDIDDEEGYTAV